MLVILWLFQLRNRSCSSYLGFVLKLFWGSAAILELITGCAGSAPGEPRRQQVPVGQTFGGLVTSGFIGWEGLTRAEWMHTAVDNV